MFIKEIDGQFIFANAKKSLRYKKYINEEIKNIVVFNPQPEHFIEAGYKELITVEMPEIEPNQYVETTYELKDNKYYEIHNIFTIPDEVIFSE